MHDLSVPPAFILSQNQTLLRNPPRRVLLPRRAENSLVNYMKLTMFLPWPAIQRIAEPRFSSEPQGQSWFNYVSNCLPVQSFTRRRVLGSDWVSKVQITTKLNDLSSILGQNKESSARRAYAPGKLGRLMEPLPKSAQELRGQP